jgi:adenylate cyclase
MTAEPQYRVHGRAALFPRPLLLAVLVALVTTLLLADLMPRYAPGLLRMEHALADARTALLSDRLPSQHPRVAIVAITDRTLDDYKVRLPIDRLLLAKLVDAVDAAGAQAIGIDVLFYRTGSAGDDDALITAIRHAHAKVVVAAGDQRVQLTEAQSERQKAFLAAAGCSAGFANLATERDWVVRFKAQPAPGSPFQKSFSQTLAEAGGVVPDMSHRRIAWLREPSDGSDTFQTIPAETLLRGADDPLLLSARDHLKGKVVIIGGLLPDVDQHLTPLTSHSDEPMPGALIHAHMLAELLDGRHVNQLEVDSLILRLGLALLTVLGFLVGWRYRLRRKGILLGSLATVAILALDTIAFSQVRIILPMVLALLAWFIGEFSGHWLGKWLGPRPGRSPWFAK